ncbi:hypothetical protein [Brochothrix thermosphacta]|uniref:hypothetical protein n=1 Tax=Brochothrix thermosphacta TaxID=2756 RepID=UPI00083FBF0D|nr:hypothetical protein [Brochothrix thermosphacta]ODJ73357.1 hypothetical protein BFR39_03285 [Brochothrix thermosphacta]
MVPQWHIDAIVEGVKKASSREIWTNEKLDKLIEVIPYYGIMQLSPELFLLKNLIINDEKEAIEKVREIILKEADL